MINFLTRIAVYLVVPLLGILIWGWDWRSVLLLYWLENITVGLQTMIQMVRTPKMHPDVEQVAHYNQPTKKTKFTVSVDLGGVEKSVLPKPAMVIFFVIHYGLFTMVHGVFVMFLVFSGLGKILFSYFGPNGELVTGPNPLIENTAAIDFPSILLVWLFGTIIQISVSLFAKKENLPSVQELFLSPYKRIFALHITILLSVGLIMVLGWPAIAGILLIVLHFFFDALSFRNELRAASEPGSPRKE